MRTAIVWFRRDLRLADNAALAHALEAAERLIPVYLHCPNQGGSWKPGAASRWWLHHSLAALAEALAESGARLVIRRAPSALAGLRDLIQESKAECVCWNRLYEPAEAKRDAEIAAALGGSGIEVATFPGHLLLEPEAVRTGSGGPYKVYTPFARAARARLQLPQPLPAPRALPSVPDAIASEPLEALALKPRIPWDAGLAETWQPGEAGAWRRLYTLGGKLERYPAERDRPARDAGSRLSPHLHFGEVGPAQVWRTLEQAVAEDRARGVVQGAEALERELLWREFAHHVLHRFPHTSDAPLDARFRRFRWRRSRRWLAAWQHGRTGIPIVDAGMRELWATGFMHNRVRMIVASFLAKHMRLPWLEGARWFWDTLVDADLANNSLNWQWVAGCGADAAPYFRIFNPVLQSRKFDASGEYIARWLPALDSLPARYRHAPWEAPEKVLGEAGLTLGRDTPRPLLDLAEERAAALAAFRAVK